MNELLPIILPIATLILGAGLTYWTEARRWRRQVQHEYANRMWEARSELYVQLLELTLYKGEENDAQLSKLLQNIAGRVHVFASDEVEATFNSLLFYASALPRESEDEQYTRSERIGIVLDDLLSEVRWEIQGTRPKPPRFERLQQLMMGRRRYERWRTRRSVRRNVRA